MYITLQAMCQVLPGHFPALNQPCTPAGRVMAGQHVQGGGIEYNCRQLRKRNKKEPLIKILDLHFMKRQNKTVQFRNQEEQGA